MAVTSKPCSLQRFPAEVSQAEPGSVHDITAARLHALPALYWAAAGDLPTLADPGYEGIGILIPVRQPAGEGNWISIPALATPSSARCAASGTRVRLAHRPLARPPAHHPQPRQDRRHRPCRPRPDHFEHGCIT